MSRRKYISVSGTVSGGGFDEEAGSTSMDSSGAGAAGSHESREAFTGESAKYEEVTNHRAGGLRTMRIYL